MNFLYPASNIELEAAMKEVLAYREFDEKVTPDKLKGVTNIIKTWRKNKSRFLKHAFKECTVIEIDKVNVHLDNERKKELVDKFIDLLTEDWCDVFEGFEKYQSHAADLSAFLYANSESFFDNKTLIEFKAPDGTIIKENNKISKNIKHFFDDPELVRILQDKYSELIQQDKVSGTLCASIHPLDFLSASENNYRWRSCHALNGDYANGNLSYMLDDCTIMFYIKGIEDSKLPRFPENIPWNDKKWRMFAFIDQEERFFFAGRQYPFFSQEILDIIHNFICHCCSYHHFYNWEHKYITRAKLYDFDNNEESVLFPEEYLLTKQGDLLTRNLIIEDADYSTHYNDLIKSNHYLPHYAFSMCNTLCGGSIAPMIIGHKPICPCCGKEKKNINTENFICPECYKILHPYTCDCCGKIVYDNFDWLYGYGVVCQDCRSQHVVRCEKCGREHSDRERASCICQNIKTTLGDTPNLQYFF